MLMPRSGAHGASPLQSILRSFWPHLPLVAALGLFASLADSAGIALFIPLLSLLLPDQPIANLPTALRSLMGLFAGYDALTRLLILGGTIIALILLKGLIQAANAGVAASIQGRMARRIREALAERLLAVDYQFFLNADKNRVSHILASDSWFVIDSLQWTLTLIPALAGLLVFGGLLAWLNLRLFLVVLAGSVVMQATLILLEKRQERLSFEFLERNQQLWKRLSALIQAPRVIRLFGQQQRERRRTSEAIDQLRRTVGRVQGTKAFVGPVADVLVALIFLTVVIVGYRSGMSVAAITMFLLLLTRAQPHAKTITNARFSIASLRSSFGEVNWLLSQHSAGPTAQGIRSEIPLDRAIILESVSYSYPNGTAALDSVSAVIEPGVATAIIGESGSGKTTLVNVLCRLIEPTAGDIRLGETSIRKYDAGAWRQVIAVAGQESELVPGTLRENISYARPNATPAEIEDAARAAGAHDFIETLPNRYESQVGPDGLSLSGGQRQRIGLARALLRRPELLILDEATSAVDAVTEREIMKLIAEHRFFRTLLVVSHRPSTIAACEYGIVLDKGQVSQAGPLEHLPYYRKMAGDSR